MCEIASLGTTTAAGDSGAAETELPPTTATAPNIAAAKAASFSFGDILNLTLLLLFLLVHLSACTSQRFKRKTEYRMTDSDRSKKQKPLVYESRLTHEGRAVILDANVLCVLRTQREADKAASDLAQRSAKEHKRAEIRLLKSNGHLRSIRNFEPR